MIYPGRNPDCISWKGALCYSILNQTGKESMKQTPETVVLVNFGCEEIQKFARAIRDRHIYTMVMPYTVPAERVMQEAPVGLILCADAGVPARPEARAKFDALKLPTLDLCGGVAGKVEEAVEFCRTRCGCTGSWTMERFIEEAIADIRKQVGDQKVVLGLSGGVDSSVVAALLHKAIGDQLTCVFVDNGLLRLHEGDQVMAMFAENMGVKVIRANAEDKFLGRLAGVADPEEKRKIIGRTFIEVFDEEATKLQDVKFLAQGTIYPDVIESAGAKTGKAHVIKSHHNVGGLPEDMQFELVEPLRELFKDEVRKIGLELGLPYDMVYRHPFPGPGLGVRILGEVKKEYADLLRQADHIFIEELRAFDWYHKTSQAFVVFQPVKSVGVVGDGRRYAWVVALRAVETIDFMTARWAHLPYELLEKVSNRIINEIAGISRVTYDVSSKPPATIEWE